VTDDVAALMVTNPSTLGTFEPRIAEIAEIVHARARCFTWTAPT
jgi:glycine cleavage system protein P-like pyridoxal-binding family